MLATLLIVGKILRNHEYTGNSNIEKHIVKNQGY
jgi:hypothetical protein